MNRLAKKLPIDTSASFLFVKKEGFGFSEKEKEALDDFSSEWNGLPRDAYLPSKFGSRYRKIAKFTYKQKEKYFTREPCGDYMQSYEVNAVSGGLKRSFCELEGSQYDWLLSSILRKNMSFLGLNENVTWQSYVHLIRIPSSPLDRGVPCPEGIHSDGFHAITIHLMDRRNIKGDETTLYDFGDNLLTKVILEDRFDTLLADDRNIKHYTSDFSSVGNAIGHRDVLLTSFEKVDEA